MKTIITTDKAPKAIGPYSMAVRTGGLIFTAGQLGIDPATGRMVSDSVVEQATQVMRNITEVLAAAGASLQDIVKTTIFLTDMADFATVNEIYGSHFDGNYPARSTVAVKALPAGGRVEIEAVAAAS
jgi:2-iminobutanoate/2-iminopropanoate deaminase